MILSLTEKEMKTIQEALESADHLIGEEYQTLSNDLLKEEYDRTLEILNKAKKLVREKST